MQTVIVEKEGEGSPGRRTKREMKNPYLLRGRYPEDKVREIFQYVDDHPELNLREIEKVFGLPEDIISQLKRTRPDLAKGYALDSRTHSYAEVRVREIFKYIEENLTQSQKDIEIKFGLPIGTISQLKRTRPQVAAQYNLRTKVAKKRKYDDAFVLNLFRHVKANPQKKFKEIEQEFSLPECTISNLRQTRSDLFAQA
jgi:hypothetical protein